MEDMSMILRYNCEKSIEIFFSALSGETGVQKMLYRDFILFRWIKTQALLPFFSLIIQVMQALKIYTHRLHSYLIYECPLEVSMSYCTNRKDLLPLLVS